MVGYGMRAARGVVAMRTAAPRFWRPTVRGIALAMVLLALAVGFCAFDDDGDDHHRVARDLCLGMLAVLSIVLLLEGLPLAIARASGHPTRAGSRRCPASPVAPAHLLIDLP